MRNDCGLEDYNMNFVHQFKPFTLRNGKNVAQHLYKLKKIKKIKIKLILNRNKELINN